MQIAFPFSGISVGRSHRSITRNETFGRTIVEAMLTKTLVICNKNGGHLELIDHQKTGYLFNKDNEKELYSIILDLIDNQNSKKMGEQNHVETNNVLMNLLERIGIQPNDSDLIIHKKLFTGYGIDSLFTGEVFKYLMRLRKSNLRKNIFEPVIFNEFLKKKWRRFMLNKKNKLLYWASVLLFFRPVNFFKIIKNRFP